MHDLGFFMSIKVTAITASVVCFYESQMDANKASETVKVTAEERDPQDQHMTDKLATHIRYFQVVVWHVA